MAIPKHVFNILNHNIDLVFNKQFKAKYLVELAIPCPAHANDTSSIGECLNPYCGEPIDQLQAYDYLNQFKTDHPYAQISEQPNEHFQDLKLVPRLINRYYDKYGLIIPLDQSFKQKRVNDKEFQDFITKILNKDGFKSSGELYHRFIYEFNFNHWKEFQIQHNALQSKYGMYRLHPYISRNTFNRYLRDFFEQHKTQMSQFKYKILKSPNTKIGYYTRKNRTKKIISSEISK